MTTSITSIIQPVVTERPAIRDYWSLLKPGVMMLVVFTGAIGLFAAPHNTDLLTAFITILAIAMGSGGGAAINMWYDADIDRIMTRTQKRPIPSGRIEEQDVLLIGIILSVFSVMLLGLSTNWAAGGLLAFAIWFYAVCYTMMLKRYTSQNIVIGGAAGAFPPLIGWLAVSPTLHPEPVIYFLIIFFWTPPHFWALALYRHKDYSNAHIPMLPSVKGERITLHHILIYSIILICVSLLPVYCNYLGTLYAASASASGSVFLYKAFQLWKFPNNKKSMQLFGFSIIYLFILFASIALDKLMSSAIMS